MGMGMVIPIPAPPRPAPSRLHPYLLTRLPIEGRAVSTVGRQLSSWHDIVHHILGEHPPAEVIRGSSLRCTWLVRTFSHLPEGADEGTILRYALLYLIGAVLFADKTNNQIQLIYLTLLDDPWERIAKYSWGSATLGYYVVLPIRTSRRLQDH